MTISGILTHKIQTGSSLKNQLYTFNEFFILLFWYSPAQI